MTVNPFNNTSGSGSSGHSASYGIITMDTGDSIGVSFDFDFTYDELRGMSQPFEISSNISDFDQVSDGRLRYIGATPKVFLVSGNFRVNNTSSWSARIRKNGLNIDANKNSTEWQTLSNGSSVVNVMVNLVQNDYVSVWARRNNVGSYDVTNVSLSAFSIANQ